MDAAQEFINQIRAAGDPERADRLQEYLAASQQAAPQQSQKQTKPNPVDNYMARTYGGALKLGRTYQRTGDPVADTLKSLGYRYPGA